MLSLFLDKGGRVRQIESQEALLLRKIAEVSRSGNKDFIKKIFSKILEDLDKIAVIPRIRVNFGSRFDNNFEEDGNILVRDVSPTFADVELDAVPIALEIMDSVELTPECWTDCFDKEGLGQRDAEGFQFSANQENIAEGLLDRYFLFTGTVWWDSVAKQQLLPYLGHDRKMWRLRLTSFHFLIDNIDRFLVFVKV